MRRRKKKVPTLPAHINPVLPDYDGGTDKFNSMSSIDIGTSAGLSEALGKVNLDRLRMEIVTTTLDWLSDNVFMNEDDASSFTDFEIEDEDGIISISIHCDLDYDIMYELCEALDPIVSRYDPEAYFDFEDGGVMIAYLDKGISMVESADILSTKEKADLSDFIKKSNDVEEVQTYLSGLISRRKENK